MTWQQPKTTWGQAGQTVPGATDFNRIEGNAQYLKDEIDSHLADNTIHKTSNAIRTETNTPIKVEVVSSSVSETPDAGRIIFDTSQGKFFGGNGTEWV